MNQTRTNISTVFVHALCVIALASVDSAVAGPDDTYRYKLIYGNQEAVCQHMRRVYNEKFKRPWDVGNKSPAMPMFPLLPGFEVDALVDRAVLFSAYPTSPEFDAVQWRQGRLTNGAPMLTAEIDIDNDGRKDAVVKIGFMQGYSQGERSVSGGDDVLFVTEPKQIDLKRLNAMSLFAPSAGTNVAQISSTTLDVAFARSIRPFVFDGLTFLSVYVQSAPPNKGNPKESMRVIKYRGGGMKTEKGWETVRSEQVCRFEMSVVTK